MRQRRARPWPSRSASAPGRPRSQTGPAVADVLARPRSRTGLAVADILVPCGPNSGPAEVVGAVRRVGHPAPGKGVTGAAEVVAGTAGSADRRARGHGYGHRSSGRGRRAPGRGDLGAAGEAAKVAIAAAKVVAAPVAASGPRPAELCGRGWPSSCRRRPAVAPEVLDTAIEATAAVVGLPGWPWWPKTWSCWVAVRGLGCGDRAT